MRAEDRALAILEDLIKAGVGLTYRDQAVFLRVVEKAVREVEQQAADAHTEATRRRTGL